jgi:acetylornithine deacetylase/succinyl-diaminopimelate desuccinylase-like protein
MEGKAMASSLARAHELIDQREALSLEAVRDYIRQPSFSDTGEGMLECAQYTRELLAQIAPDATVVETAGWPVVFGSVRAKNPDAPTLIIYGLYDVTPTLPEEWTVDPLGAHIVDAADLGILPLGKVLVGRGVNNHKGPVLSTILAVRALLDATGDVPANLLYVIEGEEEIGSPSLAGFVKQFRPLLSRAKGVWLPCMQQNAAGTMALRRAYKGFLLTELECKGGEWGGTRDGRHIWAGHSAWIDAPMMKLVKALSTLYNDHQRLTLDGIEEHLELPVAADGPEVRALQAAFDANPQWERNMLTTLNVARMEGGRPLSEHLPYYMLGATINIQGITGGYQGPSFYTNMPGQASAKIDIRFPPGIEPQSVVELVEAHLRRRGYETVRLKNARGYAGAPALPEDRDTLLQAARITAERHGVPIAVWPIANNCSPASLLCNLGTQIPYSIAGTGHGDRAHAPDEYITVDSVNKLMHWTVDYLNDWVKVIEGERPGTHNEDSDCQPAGLG